MSWPQWPTGGQPAAPQQPPLPTAPGPAVAAAPGSLQYTPEQWAQMQQQNWNQWAQWQQQYQQWHQQYGAEYQKSMNAISQAQQPAGMPNVAMPPPLPANEVKPPLPMDEPPMSSYSQPPQPAMPSYTTAPPPKPPTSDSFQRNQPPPWPKQPPQRFNEYHTSKRSYDQGNSNDSKRHNRSNWQNQPPNFQSLPSFQQPPPEKSQTAQRDALEELSEAEKKFDKQFADWESQFNKWKEQNVEHPDKTQYREYEKKWESWRAQLLERREQMKRKRLGLMGSTVSPLPNRSLPPTPVPAPQGYPAPVSFPAKSALLATPNFSKPPPTLNDEPLAFNNVKTEETVGDFIKPASGEGIPGLDLVKDGKGDEVDDEEKAGPDFAAISKGINNILGDRKLLDMLSMVSQTHKTEDTVESNEKSNQEIQEHSNHSYAEPPQERDLVNNFDDQTRSSFSMNTETDTRFMGYDKGNQYGNNERQFRGPNFGGPNNEKGIGLANNDRPFGGPNNQRPFGGPPNNDRNFGNPPNDRPFGGPPNNDRPFSGPPNNDRPFGGPPNNDRPFSGPPNNDRPFGGPPNKDRPFGAPPNTDRPFGAPINDRFGGPERKFGGINNEMPFGNDDRNFGGFNQRGPPDRQFKGPNEPEFGGPQNFDGPNNRSFRGPNMDRSFGEPPNKRPFRPGPQNENFPGPNHQNNRFGQTQERFYPNQNQFGPGPREEDNYHEEEYNEDDNYDYNNYDEYEGYEEEEVVDQPAEADYTEDTWVEKEEEPFIEPEEQNKPQEEENVVLLKPATVIDYDHKTPKTDTELEVLIEPIFMLDYRHTPLSRIPLSQRPKWLSDVVKFIPEFDPPPMVRPYENLRRYPPPAEPWRNERYPPKNHQPPPYFERRRFNDNKPQEEKRKDWSNSDKNKWEDSRSWGPETKKKPYSEEPKQHKEDDDMVLSDADNISEPDWDNMPEAEQQTPGISFEKSENSPNKTNPNKNVSLIEDIINPPGRLNRPPRIVIILRGPPGSGKTFLAKLIKDKEVENGGSPPRILSLDDYFMVEQEKEVTEEGKTVTIKDMVYEYEAEMEESYRLSLIKSFKKTITDGYFNFIIVDNINDRVKYFGEMWSFAKQNGFQVYICQLDLDVQSCSKRNIHGRSEEDIEKCVASWEPTPAHHPTLDATSLLQSASIPEVEMEEVNSPESAEETKDGSEDDEVARSKWDNFDCSVDNLAKLDGVNKPLRASRTMEEYLQLDTDWAPTQPAKPGQKRVRWADLEEQKQQEKMRAIGFVVGQTNWDRMLDPTKGGSALTQTKYIERTSRFRVDQM